MLDNLIGCPGYFGRLSWMAMLTKLAGYGAKVKWLYMLAILAGCLCCLCLLVGHVGYAGLLVD
jgi:hypothetical protein